MVQSISKVLLKPVAVPLTRLIKYLLLKPDSVRSDFTAAASRIGFLAKDLGGNPNVSARLEADFWTNNGKGDGGLTYPSCTLQNTITGRLVRPGH